MYSISFLSGTWCCFGCDFCTGLPTSFEFEGFLKTSRRFRFLVVVVFLDLSSAVDDDDDGFVVVDGCGGGGAWYWGGWVWCSREEVPWSTDLTAWASLLRLRDNSLAKWISMRGMWCWVQTSKMHRFRSERLWKQYWPVGSLKSNYLY